MVSLDQSGPEPWIVAEPNRSATWAVNKMLIAGLALWCSLVGATAALLGLWPLIPFLGLEVVAVAGGLYHVCRRLGERQVLRLGRDLVVVQKGHRVPQFTWQLPREFTSLAVTMPRHPWDPLAIHLCCRTEQIALGEFLNKEDSRELLQLLRAQGLPVRNHSERGHLDL